MALNARLTLALLPTSSISSTSKTQPARLNAASASSSPLPQPPGLSTLHARSSSYRDQEQKHKPTELPYLPLGTGVPSTSSASSHPTGERQRVVHTGTGKPTDTEGSSIKRAQDEEKRKDELKRAEEQKRERTRLASERSPSGSDDSASQSDATPPSSPRPGGSGEKKE